MRVVVKIFGPKYFGLDKYDVVTHEIEIGDTAVVEDVINLLDKIYPSLKSKILKNRQIVPMHDIWVNGRSIDFLKGLETPLKDGDVVQIIPPFGG
ncbi:MAG: MoaD/ThiS family protein [Pyrobaculum sp.]